MTRYRQSMSCGSGRRKWSGPIKSCSNITKVQPAKGMIVSLTRTVNIIEAQSKKLYVFNS